MVAALSTIGCGGRPAPFVGERADTPARVLVFVPGITGSMLRDPTTDVIAWGRGRNLIGPKDGGYSLALPIGTRPGEATIGSRLEPDGVLEIVRLIGLKKPIYRPLIDLFEANGYTLGDLESPRAEENLFLFAYDWRQDNIATAAMLFRALEGVRAARGVDRLEVDLVCQSNGGAVCRWLSRFGDASLDAALAGDAEPPASIDVHQVVLVGTANGGSLRTLREMTRGRRYVPYVGRRFEPETFFTLPALYQDLPSYRADVFVGLDGEDLGIDVFDAESWRTYGWSIFGERARRSLAKRRPPAAMFGDPETRSRHVETMLERARSLHHALATDSPLGPSTRLHLIQNTAWDTPDRGVIEPADDGGWRLWFTGDKRLRSIAPTIDVGAKGDGHATVASQLHLAPSEREVMVGDIFSVEAEHFATVLQPETHRRLIEILRSP